MDEKYRPSLSQKQRQDITDIFNHVFNKPLNKLTHTIRNDLILNGIEVINNKTELKTKMGYFYEQLFCYLCNFTTSRNRIRFNK